MNSHFGSRVAPERSGMFCAILVALAPALPEYFPGYCTPIPGIVHPCRTGDPVDLFLLAATDWSELFSRSLVKLGIEDPSFWSNFSGFETVRDEFYRRR